MSAISSNPSKPASATIPVYEISFTLPSTRALGGTDKDAPVLTDAQLEALYKKADAEALRILRTHAEAGQANAQNCLGKMYQNALGTEGGDHESQWFENDHEAVKWFQAAGDQKHPDAEFNLGTMFELNRGIRKGLNDVTSRTMNAFLWFRIATNHGHVAAPFHLAGVYESGHLPKGKAHEYPGKAIENLRLAATRGYEPAIAELAKRGISLLPSDEKKEEKKAAPSASASAPAENRGGFFKWLCG